MTDKKLKEEFINNLTDLKNISYFLKLTMDEREKIIKHFQEIKQIIISSMETKKK